MIEDSWDAVQAQLKYEAAEQRAYRAACRSRRIRAVLDVLAPRFDGKGPRIPIFEWGHETTPTAAEMIQLAEELLSAVDLADGPPSR
jgi:hypothetical protein